jgi:hypothetical protein
MSRGVPRRAESSQETRTLVAHRFNFGLFVATCNAERTLVVMYVAQVPRRGRWYQLAEGSQPD